MSLVPNTNSNTRKCTRSEDAEDKSEPVSILIDVLSQPQPDPFRIDFIRRRLQEEVIEATESVDGCKEILHTLPPHVVLKVLNALTTYSRCPLLDSNIMGLVLQFCDLESLCKWRRVCTPIWRATEKPFVWKHVKFYISWKPDGPTPPLSSIKWVQNIEISWDLQVLDNMPLHPHHPLVSFVISLLQSLPNLERLLFWNDGVDIETLVPLLKHRADDTNFPRLQALHVTDSSLQARDVVALFPNLRELYIDQLYLNLAEVPALPVWFHNLESLTVCLISESKQLNIAVPYNERNIQCVFPNLLTLRNISPCLPRIYAPKLQTLQMYFNVQDSLEAEIPWICSFSDLQNLSVEFESTSMFHRPELLKPLQSLSKLRVLSLYITSRNIVYSTQQLFESLFALTQLGELELSVYRTMEQLGSVNAFKPELLQHSNLKIFDFSTQVESLPVDNNIEQLGEPLRLKLMECKQLQELLWKFKSEDQNQTTRWKFTKRGDQDVQQDFYSL